MSLVRRVRQQVARRLKLTSEAAAFPSPRSLDGLDLGTYFTQVDAAFRPYANSFAYYQRLVEALLTSEDLRVLPLCELLSAKTGGARVVGLRHDVDNDPVTALRCARYLARRGVCGSFYLLHTAPYYGEFYGDCFFRRPQLKEWVTGLIVAGCELGLHNDCLGVYHEHGLSGIKALQQELYWLGTQGAVVRGTVAHGSGPSFGAENFEIFAGRQLWRRTVRTARGRWIPLGVLHERSFGLTYEGTFAKPKAALDRDEAARFFADSQAPDVRSAGWMRRYLLENPCCDWEIDAQVWLIGRDRWVAAGRAGGQGFFEWDLRLPQVVDLVRGLPPDARVVLVVHPEYVRAEQ